jgi:large subunit ribosomal protein L24
MSKWIKKDDKVIVIAGNDKGIVGRVLSKIKDSVVVQGVNIRKKHIKKSKESQSNQIIEIEKPINISNVALCTEDEKKIKIKVKYENSQKKLVYNLDGKETFFRAVKK